MRIVGLLLIALSASVDVAFGRPLDSALWSCGSVGSPIFTNRPASSAESPCSIAPLEQAPYSRVPAEFFEQELKRLEARGDHRSVSIGKRTVTESSSKSSTTWKSEEIPPASGQLIATCRMSGKAQGAEPGRAVIRIQRGGATVDEVPVILKQRGETPWEISLRGKCRDTAVSVRKNE